MGITKDNIYNIEWENVTIDDIRAISDEKLRDLARELRIKWLVQERENDIKRFNDEEIDKDKEIELENQFEMFRGN